MSLTQEQAQIRGRIDDAIAARRPFFNVHGLAGTGKTYLLTEVARHYPEAALVTFSNRAAALLREKTGRSATTIHRLIKKFRGLDEKNEPLFVPNHFTGRLVLLDESSVVNRGLANDLLAKVQTVITFGDPGQLEPVSGEPGFPHPDAILHEIHRQAQESGIIRQAHRVREGLRVAQDLPDVRLHSEVPYNLLRGADIILTCFKESRAIANAKMREARGIDGSTLRKGEPVMALKNDYARCIYNGEIWTVAEDCPPGAPLIITDGRQTLGFKDFSVDRLRFGSGGEKMMPFRVGYAQTVAGAQGSEWNNVILMNERPQDAKWLYTGITRAAKKIVIVGGGGTP
jgi:exodeoxyribonuclease-5